MAKYISLADVKIRLRGKVRFQDGDDDVDNRMPNKLANRLLDEAEGQVEMDLSPRYAVPFVSATTTTYAALPDAPTKNVIRTLCELQAVIRILETDFGSGTAIDGAKYIAGLEKRYKKMLDENVLAKFDATFASSRQWKFPPLPDLNLAYFNRSGDDGYAGAVLVSSRGDGDFPMQQIDDPGEDWFNATIDDNQ